MVSFEARIFLWFLTTKWGLLLFSIYETIPREFVTVFNQHCWDFPVIHLHTLTPDWMLKRLELSKSTRRSWGRFRNWLHSKCRLSALNANTIGPQTGFTKVNACFCTCKLQASALACFSRKRGQRHEVHWNRFTLNRSVHWDVSVKTNKN